jgi:dihydrofolate reductase
LGRQYPNEIPQREMKISMIAAIGKNAEIGRNNDLLWHLPDDFKWFIKHTKGKTVIMGRNTMMSLGKPLKNRVNVVLSSSNEGILPGFDYFTTLEEALSGLKDEEEVMIIGGGKLYEYALPISHRLYITHVDKSFSDADTYFPKITKDWKDTYEEFHPIDENHKFSFTFKIYERK